MSVQNITERNGVNALLDGEGDIRDLMYTWVDGFWIGGPLLDNYTALKDSFKAKKGDVLLVSLPKTGTTWMKAILHSLMACAAKKPNLLPQQNPHSIVPLLEMVDTEEMKTEPSPRLMNSHLPFHAVSPLLGHDADVKMIYVMRNPRDTFISSWKFQEKMMAAWNLNCNMGVDEYFNDFCRGRFHGGPFVEHVCGYVRESRKSPEKVLVVRYEELQKDSVGWIKKIGLFLGYPSELVEKNAKTISDVCSFDRLSNVDVNKSHEGVTAFALPSNSFFRTGRSGDWKKHFSPDMERQMEKDIEQKLAKEGVFFQY